jgi:hypothetical protein
VGNKVHRVPRLYGGWTVGNLKGELWSSCG